ncbi:MAG: esterase [Bacteroidetes bacterium B1(2017)]|nr:MAG: esterase [Bacteroidetes bacterium B1(2017)]
MKHFLLYTFLLLLLGSNLQAQIRIQDAHLTGKLYRFEKVKPRFLEARNIDVWVPEDFDSSGRTRYAVLYMHDGQNLFLPGYSFGGQEWGIDEAMDSLLRRGLIRKTIVVGIWNSPKRFIEYNPEDAFKKLDSLNKQKITLERGGTTLANQYLDFVFETVKPLIDSVFPTKPEAKNTFMMGSSMGGLISLYALCKHSEQLKAVACVSTHWPLSLKENNAQVAEQYIAYFARHLPNPKQHKLYFDHGTTTLDAWYEPHQLLMDSLCKESGYETPKDFMSLVFPGEPHNEIAWRKRVGIPLKFLLQP